MATLGINAIIHQQALKLANMVKKQYKVYKFKTGVRVSSVARKWRKARK